MTNNFAFDETNIPIGEYKWTYTCQTKENIYYIDRYNTRAIVWRDEVELERILYLDDFLGLSHPTEAYIGDLSGLIIFDDGSAKIYDVKLTKTKKPLACISLTRQ
ncbi:hypothetical protein ACFOND_14595 [Reinekea marina]|uniref:Uncharacterized protein n=1 Tax=Reinekea marina TaxID=1310421 RepID=A0ABV7WU90_9GAMM